MSELVYTRTGRAVPRLNTLQFFIAGFASLAYQIVSFKLISISGLGDAISVAISLTAFVALSGFGALFAGRVRSSMSGIYEALLGLYGVFLFGAIGTIGIDQIISISGGIGLLPKLLLFLATISPLAFISGMLIPLHQHRLQKFRAYEDEFSSFCPVFVFFHVGGAASLLLIEQLGFPGIGWPAIGCFIASLSLMNGLSIAGESGPRVSLSSGRTNYINKPLLLGLLLLSVLTGYFGIVTYKAFDYLVGPNIRNYTVVTALIFVGLSLSALLSQRINLSFRGILGITGVGILTLFLAVLMVPHLAIFILSLNMSHWVIYGVAGTLLLVPAYALIGVSIPASVKIGVRSDHALFIVSIGNAIGYWVYVGTAHLNIDATVLLVAAGIIIAFGSRKVRAFAACLALILAYPLFHSYHGAVHHIALENRMTLDAAYSDSLKHIGSDATYEFKVVKSWGTYGWTTDHVRVNRWADGFLDASYDNLVIGGFVSLQMSDKNATIFAESMAAVLPLLYARGNENALVLGSGTGVSAKAVAEHFVQTDLVDISPDTSPYLYYFEPLNGRVSDLVNIQEQDALSFISEQRHQGTVYDLIFSTVTGSGYQFSAMLYTQGFFKAAKEAITDHGVFAFWMDNRFDLNQGAPEIIAGMAAQFPYTLRVTVHPGLGDERLDTDRSFLPYQVILGSKSPLELQEARALPVLAFISELDIKNGGGGYQSAKEILEERDTFPVTAVSPDGHAARMETLRFAYNYHLHYEDIASQRNLFNEMKEGK